MYFWWEITTVKPALKLPSHCCKKLLTHLFQEWRDCTSENKQTRGSRGKQEKSISYSNSRGDSSPLCSKETHVRMQTHTHRGIAYGSRLRECDWADVDLMAFGCSVWWNPEAVRWRCVGVSKMSCCNMPQVKCELWTYWVKIRSRLQAPVQFDYINVHT